MRDRNLWLLYFAFLVVGFDAAIPMVFGPFFVSETTRPESAQLYLALVFAVPASMAFVGQNVWGALFDHSGRWKPFVALPFFVTAAAFGGLTMVETCPQFIALVALGTFSSVALIPVGQVYATVTYPESRGQLLGALFAFESLGWGLACLTGASEWAKQSNLAFLGTLFAVCAALSLAAGVLLAVAFSAETLANHAAAERTFSAMIDEWSALYHDRRILRIAAVLFFVTLGSTLFLAFYTPYLCEVLKGSKRLLGLSLAGGTFVAAMSFPVYGRVSDRLGRRPLILIATVAYACLFGSFVFIRDPELLALLYAVPLYPAIRVGTNAFLADLTTDDVRGGGLGLIEGVQAVSGCVAPLVGYAVLQGFGYRGLPVTSCLVFVFTASLVARSLDLPVAAAPLAASPAPPPA